MERPMYHMNAQLILASTSPRRKELLQGLGLDFKVVVSGVQEVGESGESTQALVERLAIEKSMAVAKKHPDCWVLGADTDVEVDGEVLGKPRDSEHAIELLKKIQGRCHLVWGAFSLVHHERGVQHVESHVSMVDIRSMNEGEMRAYVATKEPLDKAGSYAIQGLGACLVSAIQGSYSNVVGLNVSAVVQALMLYQIISLNHHE